MSHWQDYTKFGFRERSRANISKSFRKQAVIDPHDEDCANTKEAWPSALCNSPCTFLVARPSVRQRTSEVQNDPQELTLAAITAHYSPKTCNLWMLETNKAETSTSIVERPSAFVYHGLPCNNKGWLECINTPAGWLHNGKAAIDPLLEQENLRNATVTERARRKLPVTQRC